MEKKIDRLNKNIYQYKKYYSQKKKMIVGLQNQNQGLIEKLAMQNFTNEKRFKEAKAELENVKKQIEYLKYQSTMVDKQKSYYTEEELKKIITANKVLNDDKIKLL